MVRIYTRGINYWTRPAFYSAVWNGRRRVIIVDLLIFSLLMAWNMKDAAHTRKLRQFGWLLSRAAQS